MEDTQSASKVGTEKSPRLDVAAAGHLDFLVAAALRRLTDGRAPVVAAISDIPRLSPAEALEDYQRQGLSAPQGEDVYSRAKALLGGSGYQPPAFSRDGSCFAQGGIR